jgi:hypothetical protein
MRLRAVALAGLSVLLLAGCGVAYAAIPDSDDGEIHACRADAWGGALRVIDAEASATCAAGETELVWNQVGPQGPAGPMLPTYVKVVNIPNTNTAITFQVDCNSGDKLLSGSAFRVSGTVAATIRDYALNTGSEPVGIVFRVESFAEYTASAVCMDLP